VNRAVEISGTVALVGREAVVTWNCSTLIASETSTIPTELPRTGKISLYTEEYLI
jgi:hypothetical protein